jgi:hypothetical protein
VKALTAGGSSGVAESSSSSQQKCSPLACPSDRALKQDLDLIGTHPLGIGVYLYSYKPEYRDTWGHGRHLGVMANEVETVMPEAVSTHPDGYKMVDYAMLGIHQGPLDTSAE